MVSRRMRVVAVLAGIVVAGALVAGAAAPARAALVGKEVKYTSGKTTLKGYLVWDDAVRGKRPGVLVVHEWWGQNEYARRRAKMLAELGYVALAVDMYGDGKTATHPEDAAKFSAEVMKNAEVTKSRFVAGLEFLQGQSATDPKRIAAVGYCMGGGVALDMARTGLSLRGVATFHGSLGGSVKAQPGAVKAKLLVMTGAADTFIPAEQVEAFKKEMTAVGADFRVIEYPGAKHSFSNPDADELAKKFGMPIAYNAEADRLSWGELKQFLVTVFK
jgi:dienelactone hydrolase